jgi:effector-binding domain-containing protein
MIDEPKIVQTQSVRMAAIHITVPREKIREAMGPGYQELMETLKAQGVEPSGPWFTHHFKMEPDVFAFEIAVPVAAEFKTAGRVKPGELRSMRVAKTVYHGSYEGLPDGWMEFEAWITKNGHKIGLDLVEVYRVGPEAGNDSSKWQTELSRQLAE